MEEGKLLITDSRTSQTYEIPIHRNSIPAASFKKIKAPPSTAEHDTDLTEQGLRLYDPGLANTAVSESKICFIDGKRGRLQYRGHKVEDVWYDTEYEDFIYLFAWERFPSREEKIRLRGKMTDAAAAMPQTVFDAIRALPRTSTQISMVIAGMAAYIGSNPQMTPTNQGKNLYHGKPDEVDRVIIPSIAALAVCVGVAASHFNGTLFVPMDSEQGFVYNLLLMMGKVNPETGKPDEAKVLAFQRLIALGADNGHTNSTSAVLLAASSRSDPISSLLTALAAGYGPSHFGAMECAYRVMAATGSTKNVPSLIERVKRGEARLFGYGHRIYEVDDPRVKFAKQIIEELQADHELLKIAVEIDRIAAADEYFIKRKLHPTIDLYGVFVMIALDLEPGLIPVIIFAARAAGFMGHWKEAMLGQNQLWRPPNMYTGELNIDSNIRSKL